MYLMWYDGDRKKLAQLKIAEAIERFVEKYGRPPAVVLVNPTQPVEGVSLPVVPRATVGKDQFWVGDESAAAEVLPGAA